MREAAIQVGEAFEEGKGLFYGLNRSVIVPKQETGQPYAISEMI